MKTMTQFIHCSELSINQSQELQDFSGLKDLVRWIPIAFITETITILTCLGCEPPIPVLWVQKWIYSWVTNFIFPLHFLFHIIFLSFFLSFNCHFLACFLQLFVFSPFNKSMLMINMSFKASQKIATVKDYGQRGWTADFGFHNGNKELKIFFIYPPTYLSIYFKFNSYQWDYKWMCCNTFQSKLILVSWISFSLFQL